MLKEHFEIMHECSKFDSWKWLDLSEILISQQQNDLLVIWRSVNFAKALHLLKSMGS